MFRKELAELLRDRPTTLQELAQALDVSPRDLEEDLRHLIRSLRHSPETLVVTPARCRSCGFVFAVDKLHKPGKCPQCRHTWIEPPRFQVVSDS
jgi:predicted Zn-ribbon and HTH transcriptional regulator